MNQGYSLLILGGGRSSRMGRDKSQLAFKVRGEGWTLARWMSDRWTPHCESLQWVGGAPCEEQSGQWVEDLPEYRGQGPVAGLFSGMLALRGRQAEPWTLLLAVDMPKFEPAWAKILRGGVRPEERALCFEQSAPTTLFGGILHRERVLPLIQQALAQGERSMRAIQARVQPRQLARPAGAASEMLSSAMNHPRDYLQWVHEQGFEDLSFSDSKRSPEPDSSGRRGNWVSPVTEEQRS